MCRKNDGHLIRIVGPSFEMVSRWAEEGIPLKVACAGIDRYFERYYRKGPRRRPVRIDFCEADVLDVFDEWRRATGLTAASGEATAASPAARRGPSLPEHLERVLIRLSSLRATGALGTEADALLDRLSGELDVARASSGGVRGDARRALVARLAELDRELMSHARRMVDEATLAAIGREAAGELASFRERMAPEAFAAAVDGAAARLLRERLGLPVVTFG